MGCALPARARRSAERIAPGAQRSSQRLHRAHPQHPSWGLRKVELGCRFEDLREALGTLVAGALGGARQSRQTVHFPEEPLPASRGEMAARVPGPRLLFCLWALLTLGVAAGKVLDLEGKVEFCQATVGKGEPGTKLPLTLPDPVVAAAAEKPPGVGLEFPARSSALFAERNFPGRSSGRAGYWSGQPAKLKGLRRGDGKIGEHEDGNFEAGKIEEAVGCRGESVFCLFFFFLKRRM